MANVFMYAFHSSFEYCKWNRRCTDTQQSDKTIMHQRTFLIFTRRVWFSVRLFPWLRYRSLHKTKGLVQFCVNWNGIHFNPIVIQISVIVVIVAISNILILNNYFCYFRIQIDLIHIRSAELTSQYYKSDRKHERKRTVINWIVLSDSGCDRVGFNLVHHHLESYQFSICIKMRPTTQQRKKDSKQFKLNCQ